MAGADHDHVISFGIGKHAECSTWNNGGLELGGKGTKRMAAKKAEKP
jgi:hypothetical protein